MSGILGPRTLTIWIWALLLLARQSGASVTCTGADGFVQTFRSAQIYFTGKQFKTEADLGDLPEKIINVA
jgi:hypothetical protein